MTVRLPRPIALVAVLAAAVIGGLVPHGAWSPVERVPAQVVEAGQRLVPEPVHCADATCGKGSPAPSAPAWAGVAAVTVAGTVAAAAVLSAFRRRREQLVALPSGSPDARFHPPQFS